MGSGEILVILLIALVVLGPEKLPKLAADIGRWVGRARAMARQLRSQLDQEVHFEEVRREQARASAATPTPPVTPIPPALGAPAAATPPPHADTPTDAPIDTSALLEATAPGRDVPPVTAPAPAPAPAQPSPDGHH